MNRTLVQPGTRGSWRVARCLSSSAVLAVVAALGLVSLGCTVQLFDTVKGSGASATEYREVDGFEAITVRGSLDVVVRVGESPHATIHGDDNLIEYVETSVENRVLTVRVRRGYRLDPPPRLEIGVEQIGGVTLAGSGNVAIEGVARQHLTLALGGSGDLRCRGTTDRLSVDVAGSGRMNLFGLAAGDVKVDVSGSGGVETFAAQKLAVSIAGSGKVLYRGEATLSSSIAGSGSVEKAERE